MDKQIAVLMGDGIGPEVTEQSIKVLKAVTEVFGHQFQFTHAWIGAEAIDKTGEPLPAETLDVCMHSDAILFGAIGHPRYDDDPDAAVRPEQGLLQLRKALGLFANIRPVQVYPALHHLTPFKPHVLAGVDFVIYRELTGGIYFGKKGRSDDGEQAFDHCTYSKSEVTRVATLAFKAAENRRKKLTLIDKANVLETSRLWRSVVKDLASQFPSVSVEFLYVDNAAMQIVLNPAQFDVILTENMFGDILSDEASVLAGSIGMLPSASIGERTALFEPIHGSYPKAAGKDVANPVGSILSAAMMLEYFGMHTEAALVRNAVVWVLSAQFVTRDVDPVNFYNTSTIGDLVSDFILGKIPSDTDINFSNIELSKSTII